MIDFLDNLYAEGLAFGFLEIIGVLTAILYVILATRGSKWCFVFGLVSSLVYVYLSYMLKFYFDFSIYIYYVAMSFYGWAVWSKTQKDQESSIKSYNLRSLLVLSIIGILVSTGLAFFASKFSDANLPYPDAFTTVFSIIATYMVVKKYIENWLIWVVVDSVACYMYFYKELYLTAILFFIYTLISIIGYFKWKKLLKRQ